MTPTDYGRRLASSAVSSAFSITGRVMLVATVIGRIAEDFTPEAYEGYKRLLWILPLSVFVGTVVIGVFAEAYRMHRETENKLAAANAKLAPDAPWKRLEKLAVQCRNIRSSADAATVLNDTLPLLESLGEHGDAQVLAKYLGRIEGDRLEHTSNGPGIIRVLGKDCGELLRQVSLRHRK